jgi:alkylhydroperoxidase family enzyme
MPRLREVPKAEADDYTRGVYKLLFGERDPVAEPGTATGTPGNWWTVFANSPDCLRHCMDGFGYYRSRKRKLDPKLRELGQTRAGYARQCQFVFSQHCKSLRQLGFSEDRIKAIANWQVSDLFDPLERALLAYTDCLVLEGGRTPDAVFAVLKQHLSDEEILEFTYITALYDMHAVMTRALKLEFDDVPERVIEVAGPHESFVDPMAFADRKKD